MKIGMEYFHNNVITENGSDGDNIDTEQIFHQDVSVALSQNVLLLNN